MGCDGGTIPKRDELVKTKKKPEQKDKSSERSFRWKHCAVSQAPLQQPVVACEMGRIYNKETIIEALLDKSNPSEATTSNAQSEIISHIKSLRDVKVLNLTENPTWTQASEIEKGDGYIDNQKAQWICPISSQEMSGRFRFVFVWTCGCVFSERALKEMTKTNKASGVTVHDCLKCQKPFDISDVILLNPTEEEEIEALKTKMEARRSKAKDAKKSKKASKTATATETIPSTSTSAASSSASAPAAASSSKSDKRKAASDEKTKNGLKPSHETPFSSKKSKLEKLEDKDPSMVKLTGHYSVATDPKASQTYKSLFTTSEQAKDQQKAHWVTYNPFYN